jgi:hypothetical protein
MKTGPEDLGTIQNGPESAKYESWTRRPQYHPKRAQERKTLQQNLTPTVQPKMSPGAQNMKTGPN